MALQHFRYDHPLDLKEVLVEKTDDNSAVEEVLCNGCRKPIITGDFMYSCNGCHFFLHKKCAELPQEIEHPRHPKHPLTLLAVPPYDSGKFICNICRFKSSGVVYNCRLCKFDVDLNCALQEYSFRHQAHHHELSLIPQPATFHCDACDSKAEDLSYRCTIYRCQFWMHKSCASSPNTIYPSFHDHSLTLSYCIPELYRTFHQICDICKKKMNPAYWLYMCGGCRIFVHMKCATSPAGTMMLRDGKSEIEADDERDLDPNQVKFPVLDESSLNAIMRQFIERISLEAKEINMLKVRDLLTLWRKSETEVDEIINLRMIRFFRAISRSMGESNEIKNLMMSEFVEGLSLSAEESDGNKDLLTSKSLEFLEGISLSVEEITESDSFIHFNHIGHPLFLQNEDKDNENGKMLICDGCLRHISDEEYPYIACLRCDFVLHQTCAKLPMELKHPILHPEHQLKLYRIPNNLLLKQCRGCQNYSNGFFYGCDSCNIEFDLECATLPNTIKHEAHKHPLVQNILLETDSEVPCKACWHLIDGMEYRCEACDFHVHAKCATSFPSKVIHKWDDHPIVLVHGSVKDHPDVFYCEICEEEINPRYWLYFCRECDQSFHPLCLYPFRGYENMKFGRKYKFDSHPHDLTFIYSNKPDRHSLSSLRYQSANKYPSTCNSCKIWSDYPVFECAPCNFVLCKVCVWKRPGDSI